MVTKQKDEAQSTQREEVEPKYRARHWMHRPPEKRATETLEEIREDLGWKLVPRSR